MRRHILNLLWILAPVLIQGGTTPGSPSCDDGWLEFDGNCYHIGYAQESWYNAMDWCNDNGANLAKIESAEEQEFIYNATFASIYQGPIWIGLHALEGRDRNTWAWYDGDTPKYQSWHSDQPNELEIMQCALQKHSPPYNGDWFNDHCGAEKGFVCEKQVDDPLVTIPPTTTQSVGGYCPSGYIEAGNKCFSIHMVTTEQSGYNWHEAMQKCRGQGGYRPDLASISNEVEMAQIASHMYGHRIGVWIGIFRPETNGPWMWADNSPAQYQNWKNSATYGEPACGEVWTVPGPTGTWNPVDCETKRGFVCQVYKDPESIIPTTVPTVPPVKCATGYQAYWESCYKLGKSSRWDETNTACADNGGALVSIMDGAENSYLFLQFASNSLDPLWIGLNRETSTSQWLWSDNWPVRYDNWGPYEPANSETSLCTVMNPDGTWSAVACSYSYTGICKYNDRNPPTTPTPLDGDCPGDPGGEWEHFGGHCYYYYPYTLPFDEAEIACQDKANEVKGYEGHLTSIHSPAENKFIQEYVQDKSYGTAWNIWIGLRRNTKGGSFLWLDNTANQFESFLPEEPKQDDDYSCVVMITTPSYPVAFWASNPCHDSERKTFVCKADKIPAPTRPVDVEGYCPGDDWIPYGPRCFKMFGTDRDTARKWHKAEDGCTSMGQDFTLASVHDSLEDQLMVDIVKNATNGKGDQVWIGLLRTKRDPDEFEWTDGSGFGEYDNFPHSNWGDTEQVDCVWLDTNKNGGDWEVEDCRNARGYICQTLKADSLPSTALPGPTTEIPTTTEKSTIPVETTSRPNTATDFDTNFTTDGNFTIVPPLDVQSGGLSGGEIAGIVIGTLLCVVLLAGVVLYVLKRRAFQPYDSNFDSQSVSSTAHIQNAFDHRDLQDTADA